MLRAGEVEAFQGELSLIRAEQLPEDRILQLAAEQRR
jgi:hypothetical protein